MDDVLEGIILGRLDADDKLAERTRALVIGACRGAEALDATLEGKAPKPSKKAEAKAASARNPAYIQSIEVQGFRGVGPSASLQITTGPGLTLVVGRNGSGKSSFAEALELLLTGDNSRWSTRSAIWKEGWRNLHQSDARIDAEFVVEGAKGTTVVSREWKPDAKLEEADTVVSAQGSKKSDLETMGWAGAVEMYRPFLSYSELGSMLDAGPSALYDALSAILGLEDLVVAEARLKDADEVKIAADGLEAASAAIDQLGGTEAQRALQTVELLESALRIHADHGDQDCPVCGKGDLDRTWRDETEKEVARLRTVAEQADLAYRLRNEAMKSAKSLMLAPPSLLSSASALGISVDDLLSAWKSWALGTSIDDAEPLAEHLRAAHVFFVSEIEAVREVAAKELQTREDIWRPVAAELAAWLDVAKQAQRCEAQLDDLK